MPTSEVTSNGVVHTSDMPGKDVSIKTERRETRFLVNKDASRERENAVLIITLHNNTLGIQRLTQSLRRSDHCRQQFQDVDVVSKPAEDGALERGVKALLVEIAPKAFSLAFLKPGKKPWERG